MAGAIEAAAVLAILGVEGFDVAKAINDGKPSEAIPLQGPAEAALAGIFTGSIQDLVSAFDPQIEGVGSFVFKTLIDDILNISAGANEAGAGPAIQTVEKVLGFATLLPLLFAQIGGISKLALGNRSESFENSAIAHLPEELGLGFFVAEIFSGMFKTAIGTPLEEAINITNRPNRIDSATIRRLLQQHKISQGDATHFLQLQGYRDDDIPVFLAADQTFLTVSELQELYLFGIIDESSIATNLQRVGYDDESILELTAYIVQKAQTQGGDFLRSVARSLVEQHHITIDQFTELLKQSNVPDASIALEVEAIQLLDSINKQKLTVSEIKSAYQSGILSQDTVFIDLANLGYSTDDATTLVNTWINEASKTKVSLSENRILSYLLSGVLTKTAATELLISQGVKPQDATFLVEHPSTIGSVYRYDLTPATVLSAFKEGIIDVDTATSLLTTLSVSPSEARLQLQIAVTEIHRKNTPKETPKKITVAEIEKGYKLGLIADSAIHSKLVQLGYSSIDSDLLYAEWYTEVQGNPPTDWVVQT